VDPACIVDRCVAASPDDHSAEKYGIVETAKESEQREVFTVTVSSSSLLLLSGVATSEGLNFEKRGA
jgi:hypothetical protein